MDCADSLRWFGNDPSTHGSGRGGGMVWTARTHCDGYVTVATITREVINESAGKRATYTGGSSYEARCLEPQRVGR